jgi:hypothetical protein
MRAYVTGMDKIIRSFDRKIEGMEEALDEGCTEAAEYLMECIEDKFGVYQPGWKQLAYVTRLKKKRKGNGANSNKPLVDYGDMMFSFYIDTSNRTRKHTIAVRSDDEKILYHMYGVPSKRIPKRDPVRPTVKEERENCIKIFLDKVKEVMDRE